MRPQVRCVEVRVELACIFNLAPATAMVVRRCRTSFEPQQLAIRRRDRRSRPRRLVPEAHVLAMRGIAEIESFQAVPRAEINCISSCRDCHGLESFVRLETRAFAL